MIKLNDKVKFELGPDGDPRWRYTNIGLFGSYLVDKGYTGIFVYGFVSEIEINRFICTYMQDGTEHTFAWALDGHAAYNPQQWTFAGFPCVITEVVDTPCTCGACATYNLPPHKTSHSHWCDWVKNQ